MVRKHEWAYTGHPRRGSGKLGTQPMEPRTRCHWDGAARAGTWLSAPWAWLRPDPLREERPLLSSRRGKSTN